MGARVVTISAADGSGAEEVAVAVASALGYPVVSEEILARAAAEAGVSVEAVADVERRKSFMAKLVGRLVPTAAASDPAFMTSLDAQVTASLIGVALPLGDGPRHSEDELRGMIRSAIDEYMATGNVVIFAHAASHSLAGRDGVLRVFVTGSPATRIARLAAARMISAKDAEAIVRNGDANRADYLKRFYGIEAESPSQYDLVVDTDDLTAEEAARIIVSAAESAG
jgi:cytidylate kinase